MEENLLSIELTVAEVNVILRSLGKHPFEEIAALIQKIKQQGEVQLAEMQQGQAEQPEWTNTRLKIVYFSREFNIRIPREGNQYACGLAK